VKRLGILISGRGSNFEAIADNVAAGTIDAEIAVVISNRPDARGLEIARERGLNAVCLPSKGLDREVYDRMVLAELAKYGVDLVCLAGFMRLLSAKMCIRDRTLVVKFWPEVSEIAPGYPAGEGSESNCERKYHGGYT